MGLDPSAGGYGIRPYASQPFFPFFPQHHKKILQQGLRLVLQQARFYDRMVVERQGEQIGQAAAAASLGVACALDDPL